MSKKQDKDAVAIDYETFYSTKEGYSLASMPTDAYCRDPRFDAYLVAICGNGLWDRPPEDPERTAKCVYRELEDGRQLYIGRPEKFDGWARLGGRILLAHNASFDSVVTFELSARGLLPELHDVEWQCTADLASFLLAPRNLKGAMKVLMGKEVSKAVRAAMDGKHDYELDAHDYRDLVEYGGSDAVECHDLWLEYSAEWPEVERKISVQNRESIRRGVLVDREYAENALRELESYQARVLCEIPWTGEVNPKTGEFYKAGSLPALRQAVINLGIDPPKSFKKDDPGFLAWIERPTAQYDEAVRRGYKIIDDFYEDVRHAEVRENPGMAGSPSTGRERILHRAYAERRHLAHIEPTGELAFLSARQKAVAVAMHVARIKGILSSLDDRGNAHPSFLYFGAHTGRFSGKSDASGTNINMLNMPRKPVFSGDPNVFGGKGVDIRGMYIPKPGHKFAVFDYSQIEARFALDFVGDDHMMAALKKEGNLYQANAVAMGWCKSGEDIKHNAPDIYRLAKCCLHGDTPVLVRSEKKDGSLTSPYYKRIIRVTSTDRVWDGHEWVRHLGVEKMKEVKNEELIEVGGICLTRDHKVYVSDTESRRADSLLGDEQAAAMAWGDAHNPVRGRAHVRVLAACLAGACARALYLGSREALHILARALHLHGVRRGDATTMGQRPEGTDDEVREVRAQGVQEEGRREHVGEDA